MNWLKKIFKKKKTESKKESTVTNRIAIISSDSNREEYLENLRRQTDREFYDLYFNHPPIEHSIPVVDNSQIWYDTGQPETTFSSFGHGGDFGGGGASSSWDDNSSSDISSWSDSSTSYDSGSYDSSSSDNSSSDW